MSNPAAMAYKLRGKKGTGDAFTLHRFPMQDIPGDCEYVLSRLELICEHKDIPQLR